MSLCPPPRCRMIQYALATTQSIETALGQESPLVTFQGFNETALYRIHAMGPSQRPFNYADSVADERSEVGLGV